jgi:cell division protein FtsQ
MKKRTTIIWGGLILYLVVVLVFVGVKRNSVVCNSLKITMDDSSSSRLIDQMEVIDLLEAVDGKMIGEKMSSINLALLEDSLNANPLIKSAEIYKTIDGVLEVSVVQRIPVVRVFSGNGGFYIDTDANLLPLPNKYRPRVIIANGYIKEKNEILSNIYDLAIFIYNNDFWRAQIAQIYVNKKQEFELIPRVGSHTIYFGKAEDIENKFTKLMAMYEYGFQTVDWNSYTEINLEFNNQVVCIK